MSHRRVPRDEKPSFRKDMNEFFKKQERREEMESVGFDGRPKRGGVNPAMGIPLDLGGRAASAGAKRQSTKKEQSKPEEDPLNGQNLEEDEEREEF